jgi:hypothetical protein
MEFKFLALAATRQNEGTARLLLCAACGPFGSLTYYGEHGGEDQPAALAAAMIKVAKGDLTGVADICSALHMNPEEYHPSGYDIRLRSGHGPEVTVVTSTSGTRISVRTQERSPEDFEVRVEFPEPGSSSRSERIEEMWSSISEDFWTLIRTEGGEIRLAPFGKATSKKNWEDWQYDWHPVCMEWAPRFEVDYVSH